ncbi:MAG: tRNA threonylcarbamoyladenosine biosynthesis protein RimN [Gammaproteobacteria bacterium]|nr:MAG: tRNA threonylcarbamoyladenosine biosynthesis protein RimN [Gammaproteobacteria bacterium]
MSGWRLRLAARAVYGGGLIAYPTEAVYGLGCDPLNPEAVFDLLALKGRPAGKGLILIAADFDQLRPYVAEVAAEKMAAVHASWPGPHTWLLPALPSVPPWLAGDHPMLAVRVTAHPVAAALCRLTGPLVSTSANPAGCRPARDLLTVRRYFGDVLDAMVSGPIDRERGPSSIRDAVSGRLLRGE